MGASDPIRVMLVDDHRVVRDGLGLVLQTSQEIEVVASLDSGQAATDLCATVAPDVVLMDLLLPGMDGIEATRLIRERSPQTQVLVLTSMLDEAALRAVLDAGACGYLLKSAGGDELLAAVRAAREGRATVDQAALPLLFRSHREPQLGEDLTARERDVLELLVTGQTNAAIAATLGIRSGTVRVYVSNVLAKLGVANRTQAAAAAITHGLVPGRGGTPDA